MKRIFHALIRGNLGCKKTPLFWCVFLALIIGLRDWDWDKFIQHNMTLYRCMISDIHDSSYVLFSTNLISNTSLHVGRPLRRSCLVAYAEATLARQKDSATNEKCWHHFRILIVNKWSVVWNECKNREFLLTGWKSLWSLATWLVISDRYIGEVILQLSIEAMTRRRTYISQFSIRCNYTSMPSNQC